MHAHEKVARNKTVPSRGLQSRKRQFGNLIMLAEFVNEKATDWFILIWNDQPLRKNVTKRSRAVSSSKQSIHFSVKFVAKTSLEFLLGEFSRQRKLR
jgi:hypothetical protein